MTETQTELLDKDELIEAQRKRIGELIAANIEQSVNHRKLMVIYRAADHMMMHLGLEGEIHNQHAAVEKLKDAIHDFDGGDPLPPTEVEGAPV